MPRVQSVLEATIIKNAQLQNNVVAIAEECDRLMEQNRRLREALPDDLPRPTNPSSSAPASQ